MFWQVEVAWGVEVLGAGRGQACAFRRWPYTHAQGARRQGFLAWIQNAPETSRELAPDATALCHVSAKKLVGETQYWKVPHIQVERAGP